MSHKIDKELKILDCTLADVNKAPESGGPSITATGPVLGYTSDEKLVLLPAGSVAPADNSDWSQDGLISELVILGLRQGTRAELDAADPALESNEPAWETDTQVFRVGSVRNVGAELATEAQVLQGQHKVTGFTLTGPTDGSAVAYTRMSTMQSGKFQYENGDFQVDYASGKWRVTNTDSGNDLWYAEDGNEEFPWEASGWTVNLGSGDAPVFGTFIGGDPSENGVVRAKHLRLRIGSNDSLAVGDLEGNELGSEAINIQTGRAADNRVASGNRSIAIGYDSSAQGSYSTSAGYNCGATGNSSIAIGAYSGASGLQSVAVGFAVSTNSDNAIVLGSDSQVTGSNYSVLIGYDSSCNGGSVSVGIGSYVNITGHYSTASGSYCTVAGSFATASGSYINLPTDGVHESGSWYFGARRSAVRIHSTGYVSISTPETDTAFTDGGSTDGAEADGTLMRNSIGFRVDTSGDLIVTYCDASGTITEGTVALS